MKKILICLLVFFSASTLAYCQIEKKMQDEGVVLGVLYKNGGEVEGYIKKMGSIHFNGKNYAAPWEFQSKIKFIPKDVFEKNEKIKNKYFEEYEAKDCDGYKYDTLTFESVKYADMSAVGTNMLPKKMFMRKVSEDKISLYVYFNSPAAFGAYQPGEYEKHLEECAVINPVYRIGKNGKLKLVSNLNIEKELASCPMVVEKQSKGEYKVLGSEEKTSGLNKLVNNTMFRAQVRLMAIEDFNKNCEL